MTATASRYDEISRRGECAGSLSTATWWGDGRPAAFGAAEIADCARAVREPVHVLTGPDRCLGLGLGGRLATGHGPLVLGTLPPLYPEWLGDRSFCEFHEVRFPYVAGEMANGIATTALVIEMARAQMLGFFGAAGLEPARIEAAVAELAGALPGRTNWGVNLIHSPDEPSLEDRVADVLLRRRVPRISMSAYLELTPAAVRCAVSGLRATPDGRVVRPTAVFAKVSRAEVAARFLAPAPASLLRVLLERGQISAAEAELAASVPVATDVTVEADSGGHTDNRPLAVVLPVIQSVARDLIGRHRYAEPPRVGAGGGLGCPAAVAAAFAAGAAYVLIGSVNQSAVESGISTDAKAMLARADIPDVAMAPAADMFELGVKVQVLRRGTMFAVRAARLYEAYRCFDGLDAIPAPVRTALEREVLGASFEEVWANAVAFWRERDPTQLDRAGDDPKHRMALTFRWYLGMSSRWAIEGRTGRRTDYQLWCGPAMGAFNQWTAGTFLAEPANRTVVQIARNLLEGAAVLTRAQQLRSFGVPVPPESFSYSPRPLS